ncbi:MAG: DUF433 domain-containing protein [Planctomycetaceae bacterium]|nr:DUF433 domain-containing protein [Planctomycetaceae bacterium]
MTHPVLECSLINDPLPLRADEGGGVRIGGTRVSLDVVVEGYENGLTPEDLVAAYDTLALADVHAVIAFYLRHRSQVRDYLNRRNQEAQMLRSSIEAVCPPISRAALIARRHAMDSADAASGQ